MKSIRINELTEKDWTLTPAPLYFPLATADSLIIDGPDKLGNYHVEDTTTEAVHCFPCVPVAKAAKALLDAKTAHPDQFLAEEF